MLAITSGRDYATVKGTIEAIVAELKIAAPLQADDAGVAQLDPAASCRLLLGDGKLLGYVGRLRAEGIKGSSIFADRPPWPR